MQREPGGFAEVLRSYGMVSGLDHIMVLLGGDMVTDHFSQLWVLRKHFRFYGICNVKLACPCPVSGLGPL